MPDARDKPESAPTPGIEIKEEDILEAMRAIPGYLDITPGDFKEVYRLAFQHALERLSRAVTAAEIMTTDVVTVTARHAGGRGGRGHGPAGGIRGARGRRRAEGGGGHFGKRFPDPHGRSGRQKLHEPGGGLPDDQRLRGPAHRGAPWPGTS